jgi:hypothetical protein
LQKIFEANCDNVALAHDGAAALYIYKKNPNYSDLILSDSLMLKWEENFYLSMLKISTVQNIQFVC